MEPLTAILSSRTRAEVLRLLFGPVPEELHLRELARRSRLAPPTLRQDLARLAKLGLVVPRRDGNRLYYRANTGHPLYVDIRSIVLKTAGLCDVLRKTFGTEGIQTAFVFGSVARDEALAESDVDLMVIGEVTFRELSRRLAGLSDRIGREVNPHVLTSAEFRKRRRSGEHFVTSVLSSPRLFVIGGEDELTGMG